MDDVTLRTVLDEVLATPAMIVVGLLIVLLLVLSIFALVKGVRSMK